MNLNDFVVLPNNKAKSVKLNARNLQELQKETVNLALESKEMEEKLQQLKESMSKEKKERGHSGGFTWKSGQCGSLNSTKKNKENRLQKVSTDKVKIRVLKEERLTAPPQPLPPPPASTTGLQISRKNRLRGPICGQCEVKTAGMMCAECTVNYCIGCFSKFHQKGALKLHTMIPIQTDLQTHVSTPDVISSFQKHIDHSLYPNTSKNLIPSPSFKAHPNPQNTASRKCDLSPEKTTKHVTKPMPFHPDPSQVLATNEGEEKKLEMTKEELKKKDEDEFPTSLLRGEYSEEESARSFQEALRWWREEKSDATGEPTSEVAMWIPERPVSVSAMATQVDLPPGRGAEGRISGRGVGRIPVILEFTEDSLTYMDRLLLKKHRRTPIKPYHISLGFAKDLKTLPNTNTEEETANSLTAQEEDFRHYCASLFAVSVSRDRAEPQITTPESCLVIEVLDKSHRDINAVAVHVSGNNKKFPSVQQVSSKQRLLVPQTTLTSGGFSNLNPSSPRPTQPSRESRTAAQTKAAMPSKSRPPACPTAESPTTSETSIKTSSSKSKKPKPPPNVHKSKPDYEFQQIMSFHSLPQFQTEIPKFSHVPPSCSHNVSPVQKGSASSPLPDQPQFSQLIPKSVLPTKFSQSPSTNLEFPTQFQHLPSLPEFLPSSNPLQHPLSLASSTPYPQPRFLEPSPTDTHCVSSHPLSVIQNPPSPVKMEVELSSDSGDEISSDSLGLAPHEVDSSDEDAQMYRNIRRGSSRREEQGNPAMSPLGYSFVSADAGQEDLQTDEPEHLSEPSMVFHSQSAGSGSELLCDLHEFMPLGLDLNSGHSDTAEHTHSDPLHTCQTSLQDLNQTGSEAHGPGNCLSTYNLEKLVFDTTIDTQPTTSARRGEKSANELGADELVPVYRPLSQASQEIMEICNVDQTGCEDPDLDTDTTAHTLHSLEQELRLLAQETEPCASVFGLGNSGSQAQRGNQHLTKGRVSEKQKEEEEAAQGDLQSVLLLS